MRENGTSAVDYESGHSRRLDSAVRMNVLDGMRHMNQRAMEEVGRQIGADGVEIDAHMLCAEDHLPYQGGQYTNEEFEQIQDSLPRPFGEWNCRHSWHGIIMGVSPPAYTQDQLAEMRRYSTEQITVDGRTKTRYEWSQVMRRIETSVRQQKEAATLARATGDEVLRRKCQTNILELNRYYGELTEKVGLGLEFQRTYVPEFKDVKYTEMLSKDVNRGTMFTKLDAEGNIANPMNRERYIRMSDSLERHGIKVMQAQGEDLRYLKAIGAEASYGNGYIMHRGPIPSASGMFEEVIHAAQARIYGETLSYDPVERASREIAAQHKLIRNSKAYGFTPEDYDEIQTNLDIWSKEFIKQTGKEYDPDDQRSPYYRGF